MLGGISALVTATVASVGTALFGDGETAGLRVAHASLNGPNVDVNLNGSKLVSDLLSLSVTDCLEVPAGKREMTVNVAGTNQTVFSPRMLNLDEKDYTAGARGEVSSDDTEFTVSLCKDTNSASLGDDGVRVRAIYVSPGAPAVEVTVNDDALIIVGRVSFGEPGGYAAVPAAECEVEIRLGKEDNDGIVVEESEVILVGRSTYSVFAVGYLTTDGEDADEDFGLVLVEDTSAPPRGGDGKRRRGRRRRPRPRPRSTRRKE